MQGVAPVENLLVTFYGGETVLGELYSTQEAEGPVSETFSYHINSTKDDDGVLYWCEAKLDVGGPEPLLVASQKLSASTSCECDNR